MSIFDPPSKIFEIIPKEIWGTMFEMKFFEADYLWPSIKEHGRIEISEWSDKDEYWSPPHSFLTIIELKCGAALWILALKNHLTGETFFLPPDHQNFKCGLFGPRMVSREDFDRLLKLRAFQ